MALESRVNWTNMTCNSYKSNFTMKLTVMGSVEDSQNFLALESIVVRVRSTKTNSTMEIGSGTGQEPETDLKQEVIGKFFNF